MHLIRGTPSSNLSSIGNCRLHGVYLKRNALSQFMFMYAEISIAIAHALEGAGVVALCGESI